MLFLSLLVGISTCINERRTVYIYTIILSKLHHTRVRVLMKAYSKRRRKTMRKKTSKTKEESLGDFRILCCVCLFIYFCSGLRALYTLNSLFLSFFLSLSSFIYTQIHRNRFQAIGIAS